MDVSEPHIAISDRWNLYGGFSFQARYNIAPSQEVAVVIRNNDGRSESQGDEMGSGAVLGTGFEHGAADGQRSI